MDEVNSIMVCIHCMTYNHEKYLANALEGFIMQKTDFPFVAVVIDDCSTDGTADVLHKYEEKYPEIIKAVYLKENYYSQHKSKQPFLEPWDSKAKYIALCEGDDYWTDPLKLQKQVEFLESHPDFSMCFHRAKIVSTTDKHINVKVDSVEDREYFTNDIFPDWIIPTASVIYRKDSINSYTKNRHPEWKLFGDIVLFLKCTHTGRIWGMSEEMSVYLRHDGGASNQEKNLIEEKKYLKHLLYLLFNFPQLNGIYIRTYFAHHYYSCFRGAYSYGTIKRTLCLPVAILLSPKLVLQKYQEHLLRK